MHIKVWFCVCVCVYVCFMCLRTSVYFSLKLGYDPFLGQSLFILGSQLKYKGVQAGIRLHMLGKRSRDLPLNCSHSLSFTSYFETGAH